LLSEWHSFNYTIANRLGSEMALCSLLTNLLFIFGCSSPKLPEGAKRHAIVIVVDTLRADALTKAKTPIIDGIATDGAVRAWSAGTWTAPSVVSLFLGQSIREHGWDFSMPKEMQLSGENYPEIPSSPTIAEVLKREGFKTHGYYANPLLHRELGFDRGFDDWSYVDWNLMVDYIRMEAKLMEPDERHFIYIHLYGPHQPLRPSLEARNRWGVDDKWLSNRGGMGLRKLLSGKKGAVKAYRNAYHAVVEDVDERVGQILADLSPFADDAVFVLTSDHGELLGEHGEVGHGPHVYEPLTQVPFVAKGGSPLPQNFNNVILSDYLCRALKVEANWSANLDDPMPLVSQREGQLALSPDGRYKGIWADGFHAYDLVSDPMEEEPIEGRDEILQAVRADWMKKVPEAQMNASKGEIQDELIDGLKSLGYLE
jgi:hypothetical protein